MTSTSSPTPTPIPTPTPTRLAPDLVIANREENRKLDVARLREAGLAVWVTVIESVPGALASMRRLLTGPLGLVLLPDEPYPFTAADGPGEFPAQRVVPVSGLLLTWYGPSLATARADLLGVIGSA